MIFDLLILGGLLLFGFIGYRYGLFKKIFALLGLILGLILATKCMIPCGRLLVRWFGFSVEVAYVVAFFWVLLLIILLQNVLYRLIVKKTSSLNLVNRVAGAFLGGVEGMIGISLLLLMLSVFEVPTDNTKRASYFYKPVLNFAPTLFDLITPIIPQSESFYEILKEGLQQYKLFE